MLHLLAHDRYYRSLCTYLSTNRNYSTTKNSKNPLEMNSFVSKRPQLFSFLHSSHDIVYQSSSFFLFASRLERFYFEINNQKDNIILITNLYTFTLITIKIMKYLLYGYRYT
jgi:hypothetical protein